jgi:hypothetical protein
LTTLNLFLGKLSFINLRIRLQIDIYIKLSNHRDRLTLENSVGRFFSHSSMENLRTFRIMSLKLPSRVSVGNSTRHSCGNIPVVSQHVFGSPSSKLEAGNLKSDDVAAIVLAPADSSAMLCRAVFGPGIEDRFSVLEIPFTSPEITRKVCVMGDSPNPRINHDTSMKTQLKTLSYPSSSTKAVPPNLPLTRPSPPPRRLLASCPAPGSRGFVEAYSASFVYLAGALSCQRPFGRSGRGCAAPRA